MMTYDPALSYLFCDRCFGNHAWSAPCPEDDDDADLCDFGRKLRDINGNVVGECYGDPENDSDGE